MAKRVGAESRQSVVRVIELLLLVRPGLQHLESRCKVINMEVQVHGRPVAIVVAHVSSIGRGFRVLALLGQRDRHAWPS